MPEETRKPSIPRPSARSSDESGDASPFEAPPVNELAERMFEVLVAFFKYLRRLV